MGALYANKVAKDLAAGDTIQVWWGTKRATVIGFRLHNSGNDGWAVADFADGHSMTITPYMVLKVVS